MLYFNIFRFIFNLLLSIIYYINMTRGNFFRPNPLLHAPANWGGFDVLNPPAKDSLKYNEINRGVHRNRAIGSAVAAMLDLYRTGSAATHRFDSDEFNPGKEEFAPGTLCILAFERITHFKHGRTDDFEKTQLIAERFGYETRNIPEKDFFAHWARTPKESYIHRTGSILWHDSAQQIEYTRALRFGVLERKRKGAAIYHVPMTSIELNQGRAKNTFERGDIHKIAAPIALGSIDRLKRRDSTSFWRYLAVEVMTAQ
jgi:hypothetical protein